jgi:LAO/AO transport system kinase
MTDQSFSDDWRNNRKERLESLTCAKLLPLLLANDRAGLASAITLIENNSKEFRKEAKDLISAILPRTGGAWRIGITGVPGVGKSTFIEEFGKIVLKNGHKLAVLAIDPSSTLGGGSILGDKTRMNWLAVQDNVFIRPTPTGNMLGGVARHTREAILLCEAAGYDVIIIETVGVGQSETEVHSMVDFFLLLMLAGAGDELQGIKRGIIEMADAIVITKADGDNKLKAEEALRSYQNALHLYSQREDGWMPKVQTCSSLEGWKIDAVYQLIRSYFELTQKNGAQDLLRSEQNIAFFNDNIANLIQQDFFGNQTWKEESIKYQEKVKKGLLSPFQAAEEMYAKFKANR